MELAYKPEIKNAPAKLMELREIAFEKLNNGYIPTSSELNALMKIESNYRICGICRQSVSSKNAVFTCAKINIKGNSIFIGFHAFCLYCELNNTFLKI